MVAKQTLPGYKLEFQGTGHLDRRTVQKPMCLCFHERQPFRRSGSTTTSLLIHPIPGLSVVYKSRRRHQCFIHFKHTHYNNNLYTMPNCSLCGKSASTVYSVSHNRLIFSTTKNFPLFYITPLIYPTIISY